MLDQGAEALVAVLVRGATRGSGDREKQGDDDMGTDFPSDTSSTSTPTLQREVCDKCGSRMTLQSSAYGFERWECPKCHQIVGIDRDPEVGGRFQIDRGQP